MATEAPFKRWPARYKAAQIEIFESERFQNWVTLNDVRKAVPSLRKDAVLQKEYLSGIEQIDQSKRLFFNERALAEELKRNRGQDALMFLAWYEKTVIYPARRKREGLPALATMQKKTQYDDDGRAVTEEPDDGLHVPHRKPVEAYKPRRITPEIPKPPLREAPGLGKKVFSPFLRVWRGQVDLRATFFGGALAALVFEFLLVRFIAAVGNTDHYQGDYVFREWCIAIAIFVSATGPIWWCVGLMRCALRYQREQRSVVKAFVAFMGASAIMANATLWILSASSEWLSGWFDHVTNQNAVVEIIHDPVLGRLVLRGEIGFGSYKALQKALSLQPKLPLIEVESPGGYVIEGMAMAKLIQASRLDTVSLEGCASACTLLLAAGNERYLGPEVRIGFHRSGLFGHSPTTAWSATDYKMADWYSTRGSKQNFIERALDTPSDQLWIPEHGAMLEAGYANKMWSERKSGY